MTKSEIKEIRKVINEEFEGVAEKQISFGIYLNTVGYKYITILNCHDTTTTEKSLLNILLA